MGKTNDLKIKQGSFEHFLERYLLQRNSNTALQIGSEKLLVKKSVMDIVEKDPYISFYTIRKEPSTEDVYIEKQYQYQIDDYDDMALQLTLVGVDIKILKGKNKEY